MKGPFSHTNQVSKQEQISWKNNGKMEIRERIIDAQTQNLGVLKRKEIEKEYLIK